ncbi:glycine betaine ABC transporter substrate-binding protein [Halanaerobaculum tunisiense]
MNNKRLTKVLSLMAIVVLVFTIITGCTSQQQASQQNEPQDQEESKQQEQVKEKEVEIGYVQWASAEASTYVVKEVLQRMGYKVKTPILQFAAMYQGAAKGDLDAFVCAWLPNTDKEYWDKYGDQLTDLGANYDSAKIGLVVPEYVDVDSIAELKENANKFDSKIVGIDPGATEMQIVNKKTMPSYEIDDWKLVGSSGPAMATTLGKAIREKEPIVVTGWKPHWKWSKWDLKFLEDPQKTMGEGEMIKSLGRQNIKEDLPQVAKVLSNYKLSTEQLGSLMLNISQENMKPEKAAKKFVTNHPELVNSWVPGDQKVVE